jgi:ribosomal protein S18 acetylase RimI-like enzyme
MIKQYLKELKGLDVFETEDGFILYKIKDEHLYVRDIYVLPEKRKKGVAAKMADELAEIIKVSHGCTVMLGDVEPSNQNATDSIKVLLAYGMTVLEANDDEIIFFKYI